MHQIVRQKKSTGALGMKKPSDCLHEYREEISKQKEARDRAGPREGFEAITNYNRQTDRLVHREELYLAAAETGDPELVRKAIGKSGLNQMNNLRIYTAHKIATHGGDSKRQVTYQEAAKFVVELLPPELRKEFPEKRIVTIRKETDRRFATKARKLKKLDNYREFPSTDFVDKIHEFADESIKACKGDCLALLKLFLCAIAAIRLPD